MKKDKDIFVTKPYLPNLDEYIECLKKIWESDILTNKGPMYCEFLKELSNKLKSDRINLFCNGHSALECSLKSLEMKKGGEIITTPFTFVSTTHAIVNCGFKPVFCDIKEDNMTIDVNKIENLITDKTVGILPVHVYGFSCNTEEIEKIAKKNNLKIIYDAAHAFGVEKNGKSILNYGDVSMTSFHATKIFNTIEGGLTVSNNSEIAKKQELLQNFGISGYDEVSLIGGNSKMNEFCAAMGLTTLKDVDKIIEKRKKLFDLYTESLEDVEGIKVYKETDSNVKTNYAYYPITINEEKYGTGRNGVCETLASNGIYARKYFFPLTSDMECYRKIYPEFIKTDLPVARKIANEILTLPLYYDLEEKDVKRICKVLRRKK